jgi:hypothetical protein
MMEIEIKQSGPDVPDATYPMILTGIKGDPENPVLPRHVVPDKGPNAGTDLYFWDWQFAIDRPGQAYDGTEFEYGTSTKTGPRSKMYGLLTALLNGQKPTVGTKLTKDQLVGRRCLATIQKTPEGYCEIVSFSALPIENLQQSFAQATGAPVAPPAAAPAPVVPPEQVPQQIIPPQPAPAPQPVAAAPAAPNPTPAPQSVPTPAPIEQAGDLPF